ncbi:hypothetical protein [Alkalihalobacillus deserti]|uniref:hypothetical protein n=1 Tax=Alkalihalobacillus deserti TaxID=2879466 RepID=UPI001D15B7B0|nr:hypothetical protein [Alkalihalobacillus deserti]
MEICVDSLTKDFEEQLKRTLKNNEIEFIKWMVSSNLEYNHPKSADEQLKHP